MGEDIDRALRRSYQERAEDDRGQAGGHPPEPWPVKGDANAPKRVERGSHRP
jgi:hypothetical protein